MTPTQVIVGVVVILALIAGIAATLAKAIKYLRER